MSFDPDENYINNATRQMINENLMTLPEFTLDHMGNQKSTRANGNYKRSKNKVFGIALIFWGLLYIAMIIWGIVFFVLFLVYVIKWSNRKKC